MGNIGSIGSQGYVVGVIRDCDAGPGLDRPELDIYSDFLFVYLARAIS